MEKRKDSCNIRCCNISNVIIERAVTACMALWRILTEKVLFAVVILYSFSAFLDHLMVNLGMRGKKIEGSMLYQCKSETARIKPKYMTETRVQLLRDLRHS